jgi:hypothetical protein
MRAPHWFYTVPLRLRSLLRRERVDRDLDEELAYHIAQRTQEYIGEGFRPREAREAALREWRGVEQIKEECRDMRKVNFIQDLAGDIRYGFRQLLASPGFTVVVAVSLALGIGANTAIFSLMDAVLFEMLPVKQPRQLVLLKWSAKGWPDVVQDLEGSSFEDERTGRSWSESLPYPVYERFRDRNHVFSQTFAFAANTPDVNVSMRGRAEAAQAQMVSGNYFEALGVHALHGRTILPPDDMPAAPPVAVLAHRFWQRRFGQDASVVGKTMAVNGTSFIIAGIAPAEFFGLEPGSSPDIFVPLSQYVHLLPEYSAAAPESGGTAPKPLTHDGSVWWLVVAGRLRAGENGIRAQAELAVLFNQSIGVTAKAQTDPKTPVLETLPASQGLDRLRKRFSRPLFVLMAMVGVVLLMACANAAGMLLARGAARPADPPVAHREHHAGGDGRRGRSAAGSLGEYHAGGVALRRARAAGVGAAPGRANSGVHRGGLGAHRLALRPGARLEGDARGSGAGTQTGRRQRSRNKQVCLGPHTGGRTGCTGPAPAGERGAVSAHAGKSGKYGPGVPARPSAAIPRATGLERLSGRPAGDLLFGTPAAHPIHRRRALGGAVRARAGGLWLLYFRRGHTRLHQREAARRCFSEWRGTGLF